MEGIIAPVCGLHRSGSLGDKGGFPPVIRRSGQPGFVTLPREPQPLDACRTKGVFTKACEPLLIGYKPVTIERWGAWGGGVH